MNKKIVLGVAAVAFAAAMLTPSASASCTPAKSATTFSTTTAYWVPLEAGGVLTGAAWQLGATGSFRSDGGAVPCSDFLVEGPGGISLALDLGSCGAGCPATGATLATLASSAGPGGTSFLLATIVETPAASVNFDYQSQGNHNMIAIPRPRVLSSAKNLGNPLLVDLTVAIDSIAGGLYGPNAANAVSGYRILGATSASDPGRDGSAYALRAAVPAVGGIAATQALQVDCTGGVDQWLVTQISFENGSVLSGAVSGATRVNCNPALANPKNPKVKVAPRKSVSN